MASNTPRLNLYKKDPVADANTTFNITTMLNDNWDRIDQNVALQSDLHTHANKAVLDKFSEGADGKPLYNGQKITDETTVQGLQKEIANLNLQLQASQRVPDGTTFGTDFSNTFGMTIDYTKTTAIGALAVGTTTVPVQDVTGFAVGQEVTIYDDVNLERVMISAIDTTNKTLTVSTLTKSYKDGANVARTMAVADAVNKCLKFGGWSTKTINAITDAMVVASAYDTSGNGGRKLVRLSNGWLVTVVFDGTNNQFIFYKSTDNGSNWSQLAYLQGTGTTSSLIAIVSKGTIVYGIFGSSGIAIRGFVFDATTVANANIYNTVSIDSDQTDIGNVSLAINQAGTKLIAVWTSKNSTYPNSYNIRTSIGVINTDGTVAWGPVNQLTSVNTSGYDVKNPSVTFIDNTNALVVYESIGSTYTINARKFDGSSWGSSVSVSGNQSYSQSSPSVCVAPNGRIWVTWHGRDATDSGADNIRVAYSNDGGQTWSAMTKLTNGNSYSQQYPSIASNINGEVFVVWHGNDSASPTYYNIFKVKYSSGSWGSIAKVTNATTASRYYPCALTDISLNFSEPLFIYRDNQNNKIGFYGTWMVDATISILENDIRFTVKDTDEVVAWVERDELAGFTVDAQLNGQAMTKTSVTGEDQFTASLPSVQPAEVKLTVTRANVNDDVKITKILGGVA